jgi:hypothetical protein
MRDTDDWHARAEGARAKLSMLQQEIMLQEGSDVNQQYVRKPIGMGPPMAEYLERWGFAGEDSGIYILPIKLVAAIREEATAALEDCLK